MSPERAPPDWPRVHGPPVVAARLRTGPGDFRVAEDLGFEASGEGEHDLLLVEKTGANTDWVARQLAKHAGIPVNDVGYSGLKDRHAITEQYFTVRRPGRDGTDWTAFAAEGVRILGHSRHDRKLRRGSHRCNRFRISARGPDLGRHEAMLAERWARLVEHGVPNYFGEQRFGRGGANLTLARAILGGRRARRAERGYAFSAARAQLFNHIVAARVHAGNWDRLVPGDVVSLDGSNSIFHADEITTDLVARCAAFDLHPAGTLWGEGAPLGRGRAAEIEQDAVGSEPELAEGLERARLAAGHRPLRVRPAEASLAVDGDTAVLVFRLPPGSYATSVLRELVSDP